MILFAIILYVIFRMMNPFGWLYRPYGYYRPMFGYRPMMFGPRHHHPMGGPGGFHHHMGGPRGPHRF
jgi:hypothetical protein